MMIRVKTKILMLMVTLMMMTQVKAVNQKLKLEVNKKAIVKAKTKILKKRIKKKIANDYSLFNI